MPSGHSASADPQAVPVADAEVLLHGDEPAPVEVLAATSAIPMVLSCDHASNRVPRRLRDMGLPAEALQRHIAWDPGASEVTRIIAERTGVGAVLCGYSRLVIDCNRRLDDPTLIVALADGQQIPANQGLTDAARASRITAIHSPYHEALQRELDTRRECGAPPALISIHSFTPVLQGERRPWQAGVLWDKDGRIPIPLMRMLTEAGFLVGDNEPYSGRAHWDYTIDHHAEAALIPHAVIEIRQDQIADAAGQRRWGELLADSLTTILAQIAAGTLEVQP